MYKSFFPLIIVNVLGLAPFVVLSENRIVNVAVFCSADNKVSERFKMCAYNLGKQLGIQSFGLITGGSRTGLMKAVVDGYIANVTHKNNLWGVIPNALASYDVHHEEIPPENLMWVDTLYKRLEYFHKLADAIIILPGGFGTLHECMDFLVYNQFGLDKKPILLVNIDGYWDNLLRQFEKMADCQLLSLSHLHSFVVVCSEQECIEQLITKNGFTETQGLNDYYWDR